MANLSLEERETHLNMVAEDRTTWSVFSDDPVMQQRLERIGAVLTKEETGGGRHYTLRSDQVLLRKGKRKVSEEQRRRAIQQLAKLREES